MRKLDHDNRRAELAEAAAQLIAREGLDALSTRKLAIEMGCTIGVINHYFERKEQLVIAALNWANERIFERLQTALLEIADLDNFGVILESALPISQKSEMEWRVRLYTWGFALNNKEVLQMQHKRAAYVSVTITTLMQNLQDVGQIRGDVDISRATQTLIDLVLGVGFEMLHLPKGKRLQQAQNIRFYLKALR